MSELRVEDWTMPVADLGPESPLAIFSSPWSGPPQAEAVAGVPTEIVRQSQYGRQRGILPYAMQDGYTRERRLQPVRVAVLENEHLRAAFLLEYGGRLWSLYDKVRGRELLAINQVLQPANLALRNAWFSGGVEWNVGIIGHSAFTMSPLFAARILTETGTPLLRLYEWERLREMAFQIDAFLPDDSRVLFVRVRLINPHWETIPVCWWSNAAVPERPGVRVIVPADSAFSFADPAAGLTRIPVPCHAGLDYSYPLQTPQAGGYYFDVKPRRRPWVTALDQTGQGMVQVSDTKLPGRTLFALGGGPGGKKWHQFLAPDGYVDGYDRYFEIEAGLGRSHLEHVPMPPRSQWSWLEAYGLLQADPDRVHGRDWYQAQTAVDEALDALVSEDELQATERWSAIQMDRPPQTLLHVGSGWGALAQHEWAQRGEGMPLSPGLPFDDASLGAAQQPWLALLEDGTFPDCPLQEPVTNFVVGWRWRRRLEGAVAGGRADNWSGWYHLGIMRFYDGDKESARMAWERSLAHAATPWALRNLALLAAEAGDLDQASSRYREALRLAPALRPLAVEAGRFYVDGGKAKEWLAILTELPLPLRREGRLRLLEAQAAMATGNTEVVAQFFAETPTVADLREGEDTLETLWFEWQAREIARETGLLPEEARRLARRERPVPPAFDFDMFRSPQEK
jgi:tetratricopeptide (TPR) repeat protein